MVDSTPSARKGQPAARSHLKIVVPDDHSMVALLGSRDELLEIIERAFHSDIHVRGNEITVTGPEDEAELISRLFAELVDLLRSGTQLTPDAVERSLTMLRNQGDISPAEVLTLDVLSARGRTIRPKTVNQKRYVDAIDKHTIVFGIGPAGTGKTYLAMAKAVKALQDKKVNRIILTRPAVEAGERLGFLPGTLYEKIDPYLRPLYDALHDMVDPDSIPRLMAAGTIEVAPLAYMRGRAHPVFTKVLTPSGFRPIGQLAVGDLVIGSNGEPTPVLGVYPQGEKEIFRVCTQDGAATLASGDHLWAVHTRDDRRRGKPHRVLTTREMIGNLRTAHSHRYELPLLSRPVCFPARSVPMDPYTLGLLLADGRRTDATTPGFATDDAEPAVARERPLPDTALRHTGGAGHLPNRPVEPGQVITRTDPSAGVGGRLGPHGTRARSEHVPDDYMLNSVDVRIALLQGLLDSAGGRVTEVGRARGIQYTTVSAHLRDDIIALVQSLGGVACSRPRQAAGRRPGRPSGSDVPRRADSHVIDIHLPERIQPFRSARKLEMYRAAGAGRRPMRFITSIEPAGREEAVCIQVAAADSLYVTEDYLLTHNTLNDSFIILDEAQNTSPEQMKMFLTRLGFGSKVVVTGDVTQVDLPNGHSSGLRVVQGILEGIDDIHFCRLNSHDVVRHKLVTHIVDAYTRYDEAQVPREFKSGSRKRGQR